MRGMRDEDEDEGWLLDMMAGNRGKYVESA